MKPRNSCLVLQFLLFGLLAIALPARAQDNLLITEFMANNSHTLADEDGQFSDWIEIHNPGSNVVDLNGWFLTDNPASLTKWSFPSTNLAPNGYLVVFASNKNRRVPGAPLHTNFKLSSNPAFLALVRPDGVTVASSYAPTYPVQVPDISYGIPSQAIVTTLVASGAVAKVLVPADGSLGTSWIAPAFDDSGWLSAPTGIGYETDVQTNFVSAPITDSVAKFSGVQGSNHWFYGYWDKSADNDGVYSDSEFIPFPANVWRGAATGWDLAVGVAPWTQISTNGGRPNGLNNGDEHWAIRRYVSEVKGSIRLTGTLMHPGAACGDGATARIFVDGIQIYQQALFHISLGYSLIAQVNLGSHVDFVIDPGPASDDTCDGITFTATLRTADSAVTVVADSMADWSYSGAQGEKNWFYGDYNITFDAVPSYQATNFTAFPSDGGPPSASNFWDGEKWVWYNGDPPRDVIGQVYCFPNGNNVNAGQLHWVIRRWVSQVSGSLTVDWHLAKQDTSVQGGSGVTGRVFQNGVQKDSAVVGNGDSNGVFRTVVLSGVQKGDLIDFALDPAGQGSATDDYSDGSFMNATIYGFANLSNQITSNLQGLMQSNNASAFIRIPFTVADPSVFDFLTLRMKYDDGFIALINGAVVTTRNAPQTPDWNAAATASRSDADASQYEDIDISEWLGLLKTGPNVLAIQGLNVSPNDSDFLILPELRATALVQDTTVRNYFSTPTPGAANGTGNTNLGPLIFEVAHTPSVPLDNQDLVVTAKVAPTFRPVQSVSLIYRIMFGPEVSRPMWDDGLHGDGVAGDGVYGGSISATNSVPGQMIRYYIVARDTNSNLARLPSYQNPLTTPQYLGTIVYLAQTNNLPLFHWFVQNPSQADQVIGTRCSAFYAGQFYDNITAGLHGQSSSGFPQKSYGFGANPGLPFQFSPDQRPVSGWDMLTIYADKSHMRNMLAYETFRDAGSPYHLCFPIRIQQNGAYFSDANYTERGDNTFLSRLGLDPNGALYKMYNTFSSLGDTVIGSSQLGAYAEKKTRRNEGNADLVALLSGVQLTGANQANYLYDHLDIPEMINYLAGMIVVGDTDCCHKNYYFYRDSDRTGLWQMFPWDIDLSFGRVWSGGPTYWDEVLHPDTPLYIGNNNSLVVALFGRPEIKQMYLRRLRTLMEELLQPPGTPTAQLRYEQRADQLALQIAPDAALYSQKWPSWGQGSAISTCCSQTLAQAVSILKTNYLPARRTFLFTNQVVPGGIPQTQPTNTSINFGALEYNPASGNQAQEYLQLINTNSYGVDISGWMLAGGVDYTFRGGVVIPTNGVLYLSPDVVAFRARSIAPKGGMGLFVQGDYKGQLSARGATLRLIDKTGRVVTGTNYAGNPSLPQLYLRITEIMYHPPLPPPGSLYGTEDFEYIELKNIGPVALDLTGVHFTNGIDFNFTGSAVSNLSGGQTVLIVKNLGAFTSRYGGGLNIAGEYVGALNNGGEKLEVDDAVGEIILAFSYSSTWYPITDGAGPSLVIVDENASWHTWDNMSSWRPSAYDKGSPGLTDPPPVPVPGPILVNELLSHSVLPLVDAIELYNPNPDDVDIGGWFISDDFLDPKKFRIPDGFMIVAGGYAVFDETQFGAQPGVPPSFAFSSKGDEAYLFSGDANTNLTGYVQGFQFGAAEGDVSFGRYITSIGAEHFVAQSARTFGAANAGPKVGPVVISEIMYHPPDLPGNQDNQADEYIELYNITTNNVPLFDPAFPTNTWHLRQAVDFDFPTNTVLAASNYLLVVSFNPADPALLAAFQNKHGVPLTVPVLGPYAGKLNNGSDSVELYKPDAPLGGQAPSVLVDRVEYTNSAPWPVAADGIGASLQRLHSSEYGDDPINWTAAFGTPGRSDGGGTPPAISTQPSDQTAVAYVNMSATFSVTATGAAPLNYQWRFNGANIVGATNATLVLTNVQPAQAGDYQVVVLNTAGSVASSNASLDVLIPLTILAQPQNQKIRLNSLTNVLATNVSFSISVSSSSPVSYQWRFNGAEIAGATNRTYGLTNVSLSSEGFYQVVVTDAVGPVLSDPANLSILVAPVLIQPLPSQPITLLQGSSLSYTVSVVGYPPPFNYAWRRGSVALTNISLNSTSCTFTLFNLQPINSGLYRVVITNVASLSTAVPANSTNTLTVLADSDGDGIPDYWEILFGLNPNDPTDATVDPDGDRMTNLQEYLAGTDPTDALSYLKIDRFNHGLGSNSLQFSAVSNKTYSLQYKESASAGRWTRFADVASRPSNRVETVFDPFPAASSRFYRLATPQLLDPTNVGPAILTSPQSVRAAVGDNASFNVFAAGMGSLSYQWLFNGNNLSGATTSNLLRNSVQLTDAGNYAVVVSDQRGSQTSDTAVLALKPVIGTQPQSQSVTAGAEISFSVVASGTAPLVYRWRHGAVTIPGQAGSGLTLSNVQAGDAGAYSVVVTLQTPLGILGTVSSNVTLTVRPP